MKKKRTVAVSGGFDPIHIGHVRMFQKARRLGDRLVVILNNDHWLMAKKGFVFMPERERKEVIEALACVDQVVVTKHQKNPSDMSVCRELRALAPNVFANGGDRTKKNIPETAVCHEIGCEMVFGVGRGGKVQSSSWLTERFSQNSVAQELVRSQMQYPKVGMGVMVLKNGKVLLGKRKNAHAAGEYCFPGGHLEHLETFADCARREVKEETGMDITNIRFLGVINVRKYAPQHFVGIGMVADWAGGEPQCCEPEKCGGWAWYSLDKLPSPLFQSTPAFIEGYRTGKNFWDE